MDITTLAETFVDSALRANALLEDACVEYNQLSLALAFNYETNCYHCMR